MYVVCGACGGQAIHSPGGSCELLHGCWELNPAPLQEDHGAVSPALFDCIKTVLLCNPG